MGRGLDGFLCAPQGAPIPAVALCSFEGPGGVVSRSFPVALARGKHLFPFRTEQLSPSAPMVLGSQGPGRVGRRRFFRLTRAALGRLVGVQGARRAHDQRQAGAGRQVSLSRPGPPSAPSRAATRTSTSMGSRDRSGCSSGQSDSERRYGAGVTRGVSAARSRRPWGACGAAAPPSGHRQACTVGAGWPGLRRSRRATAARACSDARCG
jgi:hypothetical protein